MAALNESTLTELGVFSGGSIYRFVCTPTGAAMTAFVIEGKYTPESEYVRIIDANVDVTNLTDCVLGYTVSDESDDLMNLKPGVTGAVYLDCSQFTHIRVLASGLPGCSATAAATLPSGFPPDLTSVISTPVGASIVGTTPGHGLSSTDLQATLYELADDIIALGGGGGGYTLPVATDVVLGGVKQGANVSIDAGGVLSVTFPAGYVLPIASAGTLGGIRVGSGLAIDGSGILSATGGGGGGAVDSVNGQTGVVVLNSSHIAENTNLYFTDARVRAAVLTGFSATPATTVLAADTVLAAFGKLQAQMNAAVLSVNSQTPTAGAVTLNTSHIGENTNLYYTDARVRATVMTGISFATGTAVVAADTLLVAAGKLQKQITDLAAVDATKASLSGTETLTNKRITPRTDSVASSSTLTPLSDSIEYMLVAALGTGTTIAAPTGTPTQGQKLIVRIKDNGTARALAWNAIFRASTDLALPLITVVNKTMYLGFIYNSTDTKWDFVAYLNNF